MAHLTATAVLRNGTLAPGVKIRFGNAAGTLGGADLQNGVATADANGQITATLTADTPAGAAKVKAQLLGPQDEVWLETGSLNFTFQPPPEPPQP